MGSKGFLTHQIRKMIRIMQVVGAGYESLSTLEKILSGDLTELLYNPGVEIPVASSHGLYKSDFRFMDQLQVQFDLEEIKYQSVLAQVQNKIENLLEFWEKRLQKLESEESGNIDITDLSYQKLENS